MERKNRLLTDILNILFGTTPENLEWLNPYKIAFTVTIPGRTEKVSLRYSMVWDKDLNFEIWLRMNSKVSQVHMDPVKWYAVRDLTRKRFIDAGKLKSGSWE